MKCRRQPSNLSREVWIGLSCDDLPTLWFGISCPGVRRGLSPPAARHPIADRFTQRRSSFPCTKAQMCRGEMKLFLQTESAWCLHMQKCLSLHAIMLQRLSFESPSCLNADLVCMNGGGLDPTTTRVTNECRQKSEQNTKEILLK